MHTQPAASLLTFISMNWQQSESQPSLLGVPFCTNNPSFFFRRANSLSRIPTWDCCHANQRDDKWRGTQWDRFDSKSFKTPFCRFSKPVCRWWTVLDSSERSLSPSDAELSSPEPTACYDRHITAEEEEDEGLEQEEISENGQEVQYVKLSIFVSAPLATAEQQTSIFMCDTGTLFHVENQNQTTLYFRYLFVQEQNIIFS